MSTRTEHDASNDVLGGNRWIAFRAGIAASKKTIALDVLKDQAMGTQAMRRPGYNDVAYSEPPWWHGFDAQSFAVPNERYHAPTAGLKPDVITAR